MTMAELATLAYIAACAVQHDTNVALAFRRALGIGGVRVEGRADAQRARRYRRRFSGTRETFRNLRGVDPDAGRY